MDLASIPLFQAIGRRLAWLNQRQGLLAQAVANANTPGYVPKDLKPVSFAALVTGGGQQLPLTLTAADQMQGTVEPGSFATSPDPSSDPSLSGNAVDLEGEMLKVADTASDYRLATQIYKANLSLLKTALGR